MAKKPSSDKSSAISEPSDSQSGTLGAVQEALREIEEKCQAIINNIEDGYYEVDLDGNFTYFEQLIPLVEKHQSRDPQNRDTAKTEAAPDNQYQTQVAGKKNQWCPAY